jgi:hypothetical protein
MDLVVVFYLPPPGRHIQAGKLVLPRKDPPSGGRACAGRQTCVTQKGPSQQGGELVQTLPNHPLGAAYYAQTASDSTRAPSGTVHFGELLAILFPRPGRHHHVVASSVLLHHMPEHGGGGTVTSGGIIASAPYTKKKVVSPWPCLRMSGWPIVRTKTCQFTWHHASSSNHRCAS